MVDRKRTGSTRNPGRGLRRLVAATALVALAALPVRAAESESSTWAEGGKGAATALANVLYIPAKLVYSLVGGLVGGLAFCVTAGNREVAEKIWEPSVGGSYILSTDQLFPPSTAAAETAPAESGGMREYEPQWPE